MIDFESRESHLLLNPRMPAEERARLERLAEVVVPKLEAHVFIATSGTSGAIKLVALSKRAILASAAAVNGYFDVTPRDVWLCVLPAFHVGGLGIHARGHLSGARVIVADWSPAAIDASYATLVSLVPAQVHDLVQARIVPPAPLRAVLVGGGAMSPELERAAAGAGWPVYASYGMTECCSTAVIRGELLPHLDARTEADGRLAFRGASLLTGYATEEGLVDPKVDGWFVTEDVGRVDGRRVGVGGRRGETIKIGGESVDLRRLDAILDAVRGGTDAAVVALPDERLGFVIHLAVAGEGERIAAAFNARVLPFERIRAVHRVAAIPRSPLGKLLRAKLAEELA